MKKILLVGEAMLLLTSENYGAIKTNTKFKINTSGAELNVAVGLARLGYSVKYLTKLGNDTFGKFIYERIKKENIDTRYISFVNNKQTGIQFKNKVINKDPKTIYYRKDSAASTISINDILNIDFKNIDLIHITGIPLAISKTMRDSIFKLLELAIKENIYITFDPNLRFNLWKNKEKMINIINRVSSKVNLIMPGIHEVKILLGTDDINKIRDIYLKMGIKKIIVKYGNKGAYYLDNNNITFVKSFKVNNTIDTVGAGDGFAVGIISSLLENLSIEDTLIRANAIGCIQVLSPTDNENLPTRDELYKFIY